MKRYIACIVFGIIIALLVSSAADTVYQFIQSPYTLYVDGVKADKPMYNYQHTNYASIRSVAEALNLDIKVTGTRVDFTTPLTDFETVAKNCKDSCVMIYAYRSDKTISQGSGWVYNGYVVTAKHVVEGAAKIDVFLDDSKYGVSGTIHYTDPKLDVAILKADTGLPSVTLGDSDTLKEGQKLVSITSPNGAQNSIEECLYSGLSNSQDYLRVTETLMAGGSSGGAVFNFKSEIIGMAFNEANNAKEIIGVIPINDIKPMLNK